MKTVKKGVLIALGSIVGICTLVGILYVHFEYRYKNRVYPGVTIDTLSVSGMTGNQIQGIYQEKSAPLSKTSLTLSAERNVATFSGTQLALSYNTDLAARQAMAAGRAGSFVSDSVFRLKSFLMTLPGLTYPQTIVKLNSTFLYNTELVDDALGHFAEQVYIAPVEPQFEFNEETNRVITFALGANGKSLDRKKGYILIDDAIRSRPGEAISLQIPINIVSPKNKVLDTENLGIVELIAEGQSYYKGSIPGRIHNVALAASRVSGILVAPGDVFSFNETVGDISAATGYKSAYIIKNGRTILGDGGGVCQVSTTVFRAALNAGLEIVERTPHSYRVAYYEQGGFKPGLDATVYYPTVDLKFRNNTDHYILIQSEIDKPNYKLTYKIYGKKDGRTVEISDIRILDQTPPPPPLYQEDPTLVTGQINQVDWAAAGAKTAFDYKVTKDGEVLGAKTFQSNFSPWQSVFLYGPGTAVPSPVVPQQ
ncbi:MAG: VanW family protein [Candidatus Roizmanbacteria bacterium]|nr:VanW family protein [Candidatus Roizmanbacteria bacterium]